MARKALVVEDDHDIAEVVVLALAADGIESDVVHTGEEGLRRTRADPPSCVVLDLGLPDMPGQEVLRRAREDGLDVPIVVMTGRGGVAEAVECMRLGACDFVQKPFEGPRLVTSIRNAMERGRLHHQVRSLARELREGSGFAAILGRSPALNRSLDMLRRAARSDVTVLLTGESGTGKEVAARAVHAESARFAGPFVAVNCGAIPEGLVESELFGHERGAFTGATRSRPGRFLEADGGTIFLDEIGELRQDLQVKLLRVLQERAIQPVGGSADRTIDVRVIAATNRDLRAEVAEGRFRQDLFFRLSVFPVELPPLRAREGDVEFLAHAFVQRFSERHHRPLHGISDEALAALRAHSWPGNVRELENVLERAVILEDSDRVTLQSLPDEVVEGAGVLPAPPRPDRAPGSSRTSPAAVGDGVIRTLADEEERLIRRALEITGWNLQETAQRLGIGRATIYRKLERYGIRRESAG